MDMTDKDNILSNEEERALEEFFASRRQTIADNGFSKQVMRKLPRKAIWLDRLWTSVWLVAIVAMLLTEEGLRQLASPVKTFLFKTGIWLKELPELSFSFKDFYMGYLTLAAVLLVVFACVAQADRR